MVILSCQDILESTALLEEITKEMHKKYFISYEQNSQVLMSILSNTLLATFCGQVSAIVYQDFGTMCGPQNSNST